MDWEGAKAAEGSRTPRPVGVSDMRRTSQSVAECGCPLCTLHGSFISNAEVCWTTRSPSPRPSPRGEGEASPDPRTLPGRTIRRPTGDDPPSPCLPSRSVFAKAGGEGRGEGELAAHRPTGSSGEDACKVQCHLPLFSAEARDRHFQWCPDDALDIGWELL